RPAPLGQSGRLRDVRHDTDDVVELDRVSCIETARHRFLADARDAHLSLLVLRIDVVDVERHLAVDADGLNLAHDGQLGTFEHLFSGGRRPAGPPCTLSRRAPRHRRDPFRNTSTLSGRPFQNESRMRPSCSWLMTAGIELAVRYHPSGST